MRVCVAFCSLVLSTGMAHAMPDQAFPMGPGSKMFWTSSYDGGSDRFHETLLAQGDDFELFRSESEWAEGDTSDYFAVFSGIYYVACDTDMPSDADRQSIAELWPLAEGASAELPSGDGALLEVGVARDFFLMGRNKPAHNVTVRFFGDDASEEKLVVLDDLPLTVSVTWEEGGTDTMTLVSKPPAVASLEIDTDLIGLCAGLLN